MMKPIKYKKAYELLIAKELQKWQYDNFFKEVFKIIDEKTVINTDDEIINALKSGLIYYQDNAFYSNKGYFAITLSKSLKDIGAKYSSWRKAYVLRSDKLPLNIYSTIEMLRANTIERANLIDMYLMTQLANIDKLMNTLILETAVETILQDLQKRVYANFKSAKIETIAPRINDFRANYIAQRYINNLKFWIQNWEPKNIIKMRETVMQMAIEGKSREIIAEFIHKRYGIDKNHALFLARNETAIATTSYLTSKYIDEGFTRFQWIMNDDDRVRPLHKELGQRYNNKHGENGRNIYRFDNPPTIDERTGQKGLPGETYNCYDKDTEVMTDRGFRPLKDIKIGDIIATVNPNTYQWEWAECTNTVKKYADEIVDINTNIFNLSVSKNHTFFFYKCRYDGKKQIKDSEYPTFSTGYETLSKKNTKFLATTYNWYGTDIKEVYGMPIDVFCKFLGYYLSDGNVDKRSKSCIHIAQCDNDWMFNELKPYMHIRQDKEKLYIYNQDLYNLVAPLGYANEKYIPVIIKDLPSEKIRVFLNAFARCDGRTEKTGTGFNGKSNLKTYNQYYTSSKRLMADLVECIYKTSMSCSVYVQHNKDKAVAFRNGKYKCNYDIFIINEMKTVNRRLERAEITIKSYNDFVYDIEVSRNHTLLIKQGKSIHWNSNCRCHIIPVMDKEFIDKRLKKDKR